MKCSNTSKKPFSPDEIAAAIEAAPEVAVFDEDNPATTEADWDGAIISHSFVDLREQLVKRRRRGAGKKAPKESTTVRFDRDVLAAFRASGQGWQTRMNDALKDWLKENSPAQR